MAQSDRFRMTRQRGAILDVVRNTTAHPTADEVYRLVRRRLPRISLGTVYRNLEMLCEAGAIARVEAAEGKRRYDGNVEAHYHVRCVHCGCVGDVAMKPIAVPKAVLRRASDYEITGHRLEFIGICPGCRQRAAGRRRTRSRGSGT